GEEAVGELLRGQTGVAPDVLEPFHAVAGRALQLQHFEAALRAVGLQRRSPRLHQVRATGDVAHQRYRIFHGELGAGADREVRRMRRIADQDHPAVVPAPAMHAAEVEPGRAAQMVGIALQCLAAEIAREELLAECDGAARVEPVEPMRFPGLLPRLDDDGGEIAAELIGVDLEPAVLGALECKRESPERLRRPEPDVAALAPIELRLEYGLVALPGLAVGAIRGDDEVRILEPRFRAHLPLEVLPDSELRGALLQEPEQALAADTAESVAAADEAAAGKVDVDVVPVVEVADDGGVRARVGSAEVLHRLVGKDDAPAEGVVRPVALVHLDAGFRERLAQQDGGVQTRGAAAQADDSLHGSAAYACIACIEGVLYCEILEMSSIVPLQQWGDPDHDRIGQRLAVADSRPYFGPADPGHHRRRHPRRGSDRAAGARDAHDPAAAAVRPFQELLPRGDLPLRRARTGVVLEQYRLRGAHRHALRCSGALGDRQG